MEFKKKIRLRFSCVGATSRTIRQYELLDLICMATAANAACCVFAAGRLRKVEIWAPGTVGATTSATITYLGSVNFGSANQLMSDSTMGADRPLHLCTKPPKGSLSDAWFIDAAGDNLFSVVLPAGAIVDVEVEYVLRNSENVRAVTAAVVGATVGRVYIRALDSAGGASLIPVGAVTI